MVDVVTEVVEAGVIVGGETEEEATYTGAGMTVIFAGIGAMVMFPGVFTLVMLAETFMAA